MLRKRSSDSEWKLTSRKRHAPIWLHEFKSTEDDVSLMENNPKVNQSGMEKIYFFIALIHLIESFFDSSA